MTMLKTPKNRRGILICGGAIWVALLSAQVTAQTYSIDWFKLAGGGGASTSAVYSISATIAQHDVGAAASANYSLIAGFWAIYALQSPGAPSLRIFLTATNTAVVAWPAPSTGWTLQVNTNLATINWQPAAQTINMIGGENQIVISPPDGESFFRLYFP